MLRKAKEREKETKKEDRKRGGGEQGWGRGRKGRKMERREKGKPARE